jgi:hypothetical protein
MIITLAIVMFVIIIVLIIVLGLTVIDDAHLSVIAKQAVAIVFVGGFIQVTE